MFSYALHGSLLTTFMIGTIGCYKALSSRLPYRRLITTTSLIFTFMNIGYIALPILPYERIQDIYRSQLVLNSGNPFIPSKQGLTDVEHLDHMHHLYFFRKKLGKQSTYQKLADLKTMTNIPEIFDVTEFHYYGYWPVCVHNVLQYSDKMGSYETLRTYFVESLLGAVFGSFCVTLIAGLKRYFVEKATDTYRVNMRYTAVTGMLDSFLFYTSKYQTYYI